MDNIIKFEIRKKDDKEKVKPNPIDAETIPQMEIFRAHINTIIEVKHKHGYVNYPTLNCNQTANDYIRGYVDGTITQFLQEVLEALDDNIQYQQWHSANSTAIAVFNRWVELCSVNTLESNNVHIIYLDSLGSQIQFKYADDLRHPMVVEVYTFENGVLSNVGANALNNMQKYRG